jgi:Methane oxygenase PmoA
MATSRQILRGAALMATLLILTGAYAHASHGVRIKREKGVLSVTIDGALFTKYHFGDDFIVPFVRPFFWPVLASDGTPVTVDQAQTSPLHPYQRSLWIGHGDVNGADHWKFNAKPFPPKQRHVRFDYVRRDGFQEQLIWEDAAGNPMLRETRTARFIMYPDGARGVDISLRLSSVGGHVNFANHKDHGLLSVRPVPGIAGDPEFTSSRGTSECDRPSAWCDETGEIDGHLYGIAIFDDPENPRHPPMWHAHKDARLATDIFEVPDAAEKHLPRSAGDFVIQPATTAQFRYVIVIHTGDAASAHLAEKFVSLDRRGTDLR